MNPATPVSLGTILLESITRPLHQIWHTFSAVARRHSHGLTAAVLTLLTGFAVAAFGIAPLAPDASELPRRLIQEPVDVEGLTAQLDALAAHALELSRSGLTQVNDTADTLLRRLSVFDPVAVTFIRTDRQARRLFEGRAGKMVQLRATEDGSLIELVARFAAEGELALTHFRRLTIAKAGGQWQSRLEVAPLQSQTRLGSGTIRSSLFAATDEAKLPDRVAAQMVEMFDTDIDFHRELRKGDTFSVIYEALTADGQPISWADGAGRTLAAEFVNNGRTHQAVWFAYANGKGAYFGLDGRSKRRAFLASPMAFSRVTSGFATRFHPIFQTWRKHNGIDYAAPTGTPVQTVGDGLVDFAGQQNGYGNVVIVTHSNDRKTVYAHLSRIDVKRGQRVEQGQCIGAVGATGWATGPHLHFEFRLHGEHQDPRQVARASESLEIDSTSRPRFEQLAQRAKTGLDVAETLVGYRSDIE
jgi:murein DD-endopeptidase MepM/ murein hydrolase activator NlpD